MRVQLIAKPSQGVTGTSRYADNLFYGLQGLGMDVELMYPRATPSWDPVQRGLKRLGLDVRTFFASYPLRVVQKETDLYHITTQTMATLLMVQRFDRPVIATVLDIIPFVLRHDSEPGAAYKGVEALFYRLALAGLQKADALIAISEYTKRTVVDELGLPAEKLHVVYPAVDHQRFCPRNVPDTFWSSYGLDKDVQHVLYVGSEDPRKNLRRLLEAFAQVQRELGAVKLLKVGAAHFMAEHQKLVQLAERLDISNHVLFFDHVADADLPLFYNAADVFVMPSLYEGFGLPALEAMASGTAVISSNSGSLPEVVGNAALLVGPHDTEGWASNMLFLLTHDGERQRLAAAGQERASSFTWQRTALETKQVYQELVLSDHRMSA
jgi:glycosyltransferase involved in cell wall biosynthesis